MPNEPDNCPACGALPVDWVDNPHAFPATNGLDCEIAALRERIQSLAEACRRADRVFRFDLRRLIEFGPDFNQAAKDAADAVRTALDASITA